MSLRTVPFLFRWHLLATGGIGIRDYQRLRSARPASFRKDEKRGGLPLQITNGFVLRGRLRFGKTRSAAVCRYRLPTASFNAAGFVSERRAGRLFAVTDY